MEFTSVPTCHCLLQEVVTYKMYTTVEDRLKAEFMAGHHSLFPTMFYFPSGAKHQVLTDITHV